MNRFYPYLMTGKDITSEIDKEVKKYNDLITRGRNVLRRHLQKNNSQSLSKKDLAFFYETHGLPEELTKILWKELQR